MRLHFLSHLYRLSALRPALGVLEDLFGEFVVFLGVSWYEQLRVGAPAAMRVPCPGEPTLKRSSRR